MIIGKEGEETGQSSLRLILLHLINYKVSFFIIIHSQIVGEEKF